jgi:hypothetical protein
MTLGPGANVTKLLALHFGRHRPYLQNWEGFLGEKHSSLLREFVNYGRKKFNNIGFRGQCYKTFLLFTCKGPCLTLKH